MKDVTFEMQNRLREALANLRIAGEGLVEGVERAFRGTPGGPDSLSTAVDLEALLKEEVNVPIEDILAYTPTGEVLRALPAEAVRALSVMPLEWTGDALKVALLDPTDLDLLGDLHLLAGAPLLPVAADRDSLEKMIAKHYQGHGTGQGGSAPGVPSRQGGYTSFSAQVGPKKMPDGQKPGPGEKPRPVRSPGKGRDEANPIIRLVYEIISEAIHAGSSDIHFEPSERDIKVRFRQDGLLRVHRTIGSRSKAEVLSRLKIMANLDIAERRRPQDGRIRLEGGGTGQGRAIDVRVSTLPTEHGEKIVLRILDKGAVPLDLAHLGLDPARQATLEKTLKLPYGMILMTGPTGAGKTTTLYTCLSLIKSPETNIVTVEDPIEYKLEGITQTAVKADVGYTFANALRTILRQDPNVIMVGEIRDRETAEIAVRAALTGHLVLSTLHTNDAPGAVTRLLDMGIEPFLLASALSLIGAQRLVRRVCPHCAERALSPQGLAEVRGKGCHLCNRTGYSGRVGLYEMLPVTEAIRSLITEKKDAGQIREAAVREGMVGLREDGLLKVKDGVTTLEEVVRETA